MSGWERLWRGPWGPLAVALLAHGLGLLGGFVMDDVTDIVRHPVVNGEAGLGDVHRYNYMGAPIAEGANTFRPLATLLFALEWRAWGATPALFHLVSVAMFCGLVLLVQRYARLLMTERAAMVAAALFASLAIHVDAVGLVANSAEVLSLGLSVAALLAAARGRWALAALAYLAALLAKESAIALPAIAAAQVLLLTERGSADRRGGLAAVAAMAGAAALFLAGRSLLLDFDIRGSILPADNPLLGASLAERLWVPLSLLGRYLALTVAPTSLSFDYTYSQIPAEVDLADPHGWLGLIAAAGLLAAAIAAWRRRAASPGARVALLVALGFAASYALFSNTVFLIVTLFAERLFLAPSLWLCLGAAAGGAWLLRRQPSIRPALTALVALVLASQTALAAARTWETRSALSLLAAQVETAPDSVKGRLYYAKELAAAGQTGEALWQLAVASAGREAFPAPWRAPREDDRPLAERLPRLPALLAPGMPPAAYWQALRPVAARFLGRPGVRLVDQLAAAAP